MTEKPYTDADVEQLAAMVRARIGWPISAGEAGTIVTVVLQELAVVGRLAVADDDPRHIIEFRPDGWTIKHPLSCRPNLFTCPVTRAAGTELGKLDGPPVPPGQYECRVGDRGLTGAFLILGRVDQAPTPPEDEPAVGGYSTTPAPEHHVIAFAVDGTWSLTHPDACPDFPDCQVRRLAERQITPDLAALVAGGRYECEAGNLGDLFQLIDRLHDDQCTPPPCTACGCWCHAEDQTEG